MSEILPPTSTESGMPADVEVTPGPQIPACYLEDSYGPLPEGAPATPAQAFIEHVQDVREHGDALDFMPAYRQKRALGVRWWWAPASFVGLAVRGINEARTDGIGDWLAPSITFLTVGGVVLAGSYRNYKKSHKAFAEKAWGQDVQSRVDEAYDLFRVQTGTDNVTGEPQYEVHMRYYGPNRGLKLKDTPNCTTAGYVKDMAALAETAGVDKLMVGEVIASVLEVSSADAVPMKKIIENTKPIRLQPNAFTHEDVVIKTPAEWRSVEDKPIPDKGRCEIAGLITSLAEIDPSHPLVKAYASCQKSALRDQILTKVVEETIRREFSESANGSKRDQRKAAIMDKSPSDVLMSHYLEANLRGSSVPLQSGGDKAETDTAEMEKAETNATEADKAPVVPLHRVYTFEWSRDGSVSQSRPAETVVPYGRALGQVLSTQQCAEGEEAAPALSSKELQELLLKNPRSNPTDAKKLILTLLKQRLDPQMGKHQRDNLPSTVFMSKGEETFKVQGDYTPPVLWRLLADSRKPTTIAPYNERAWPGVSRKLLTAVGALAAIGIGTYLVADAVDTARKEQLAAAQQQVIVAYAQKYDLDPKRVNVNDPIVKEHIREYAEEHTLTPISRAWGSVVSAQRAFSEWADFGTDDEKPIIAIEPDAAGTSSPLNEVGDVNYTGPPKTEWELEAKGVETQGYWAAATSHTLAIIPDDGGLVWINNDTLDDAPVPGMRVSLPATYDGEQYIKVSRELGKREMQEIAGHYMARVPVLEGTTVMAATLDGQPVTLYIMEDGTTGLAATDGGQNHGVLEYWLAPDADARLPHAVAPIIFNKNQGFDFTQVPYVWDDFIPHFSEKSPAEQRQLMDDYLSTKFYYTLTPDEDKGAVSFETPGQYTEEILEKEVAQCNRAATTFALGTVAPSNPPEMSAAEASTAEEDYVNIATGYRNNNDKALTDYELHMWDVESDRDRIDPTPARRAPNSEKAEAFEPLVVSESVVDATLKIIGLMLGATAAGALMARPGRRTWYRLAARRAARVQDQTGKLQRQLTADPEALHQALDILDAVRHDPEHDVTKAANLGSSARLGDRSAEAGLAKLMMTSHHDRDGQAAKQLKLSYRERRTLNKSTRQAVRSARNIIRQGRKLYGHAAEDMGYTIRPEAQ